MTVTSPPPSIVTHISYITFTASKAGMKAIYREESSSSESQQILFSRRVFQKADQYTLPSGDKAEVFAIVSPAGKKSRTDDGSRARDAICLQLTGLWVTIRVKVGRRPKGADAC